EAADHITDEPVFRISAIDEIIAHGQAFFVETVRAARYLHGGADCRIAAVCGLIQRQSAFIALRRTVIIAYHELGACQNGTAASCVLEVIASKFTNGVMHVPFEGICKSVDFFPYSWSICEKHVTRFFLVDHQVPVGGAELFSAVGKQE